MAKIYQRNGIWYARAEVKGVERRRSLNTRSKAKAQERFEKWLAKIEAERQSKWTDKETTFRDAVRVFTDEHLPTLERSTETRYLLSLIYLSEHFEGTTLQRITPVDLTKFVGARRRQGVSDSTIRRDLACLSSVFTIAADFGLCDANPVLPFLRVKRKRKQLVEADPRTRYLSHDEELRILARAWEEGCAQKLNSPRRLEKMMILAAIALYCDTGLRPQELVVAEWSWVNFERHEITVPKEMTKAKKDRVVPLLPRALKVLSQIPAHPKSPFILWRTQFGKRFMDLRQAIQKIASKAGVENITTHDLRRTCGCRLLQDHKLSMEQVSQWLGHASVTITEQRYAFLKVDNLHDAVGTRRIDPAAKLHLGSFFDDPQKRSMVGSSGVVKGARISYNTIDFTKKLEGGKK